MFAQWYCKIMGVERGPVTADELRSLIVSGELAVDDMVRSEADEEWVPAGSLSGLLGASALRERQATEEMPVDEGACCSLEFSSTDTKTSIHWSTMSTPTVANKATSGKHASLVKVPHRSLKVGHGATKAGIAEKRAHQTTVTAGFNAEADTVVSPDSAPAVEPASEVLPEHRL
jgi:hypothetical protein